MLDSLSKLMNMSFLETLSALIELAIFALTFYLILRFLHGTRGLGIMKGILALLAFLLLALAIFHRPAGGVGELYLPRLRLIADEFLTATVLAMVVVFQPEIRRGLSRLGEVGLFGRGEIIDISPITQGLVRMGRRKIGALVVVQRTTGLNAYAEGSVKLNAEASAHLLESIFYPNSPLHDGAVLIQRNRITAACCLLPLSEKPDLPPGMGTRHRAALGISEESDAIALVVSEETGKISIAVRGEIQAVKDAKDLEIRMSDLFYEGGQTEGAS
jgi:diadenylate cyclase